MGESVGKIHNNKHLVVQLVGLISLLVGLFILRISFLEQLSFISPDNNISSLDLMTTIIFLRTLSIGFGFLLLGFPNSVFRIKEYIEFLNQAYYKKNRFAPPLYFIAILCIILIAYLGLIALGHLHSISGQRHTEEQNKMGIFVDIGDTISYTYDTWRTAVFTKDIDYEKIDIPIYKLYVRQELIDILSSNLPESGKNFVNGYFATENETYDAEARFRGDTYLHWYFKKKSWRVKLEDKQVFNLSNKFNIINPKYDSHLHTLLAYQLAENIGFIVPRTYHIALFLNNNYDGVYYYSDQIDESFLRMKEKLPGDIFYGELYGIADKTLFENSTYWDLKATNDNNEARAFQNMDFFIQSINTTDSFKFYTFFNQHLGEDYLKFYAFNILIDENRVDNVHNHKFYFNPSSGKFETIIWDLRPFFNVSVPVNSDHNLLFEKINTIPEFVEKKNEYIKEFMDTIPEEVVHSYIENTSSLIKYELEHDKHKDSFMAPWSLTNEEWEESLVELRKAVEKRYNSLKTQLGTTTATLSVVNNSNNPLMVFDIVGESGVRVENIEFKTQSDSSRGEQNQNICYTLFKDKNFNNKAENNEQTLESCSNTLNFKKEILLPGKNHSLRYVFILKPKNDYKINDLEIINVKLSNSITGTSVNPTVTKVSSLQEIPTVSDTNSISFHPWKISEQQSKTIVFEGTTTLTKDLIINKQDTLIIKQNTTFLLGPGISIISYGKVIAQGTPSEPIQFIPLVKEKPWGTIALQGTTSNNSVFSNCILEKGSGAKHALVHYTGMLSAYNTKITIDHCIFKDNKIEDDAFNAKHSSVQITNSEFIDISGDAIDFDFSEGKIEGNTIRNPKNDGIDLMGSSATILKNTIINAEDKGISIGEMSKPVLIDNKITKSNIGIAIKDKSYPAILNNTINNNTIGIAAYQKNWRYGIGGSGEIKGTGLCQNTQPLLIQNNSIISITIQENAKQENTKQEQIKKEKTKTIICTKENCTLPCKGDN